MEKSERVDFFGVAKMGVLHSTFIQLQYMNMLHTYIHVYPIRKQSCCVRDLFPQMEEKKQLINHD